MGARGPYLPNKIVRFSVGLHRRLLLSFRDVEDLLHDRGVRISHESVRTWAANWTDPFPSPDLSADLQPREEIVRIRRKPVVLWTAVDSAEEIADVFVQDARDAVAAKNALRRGVLQQQKLAKIASAIELGLNGDAAGESLSGNPRQPAKR